MIATNQRAGHAVCALVLAHGCGTAPGREGQAEVDGTQAVQDGGASESAASTEASDAAADAPIAMDAGENEDLGATPGDTSMHDAPERNTMASDGAGSWPEMPPEPEALDFGAMFGLARWESETTLSLAITDRPVHCDLVGDESIVLDDYTYIGLTIDNPAVEEMRIDGEHVTGGMSFVDGDRVYLLRVRSGSILLARLDPVVMGWVRLTFQHPALFGGEPFVVNETFLAEICAP